MSKKREIRYHVIFWVLFIGLDQLLESIMRTKSLDFTWSLMESIAFVLLQLLVFYINYLWICPKTIPKKRWLVLALGQIGLMILFPALRFFLEEVVIYSLTGIHNYNLEHLTVSYYLYDNSYIIIQILLLSMVGYFLKYLWNTNRQVNELRLGKKQAELQSLKNQLSPHFLFNSLNSFYSELYDSQPEIAGDILKLSEMLRYITYENQNDTVSLKDEAVFIQNYIDIFKRRFDGNIAVTFDYPKGSGYYKIPSLLLIHFVENAFKHGITDDYKNPVMIIMKINQGRLIFTVENHYRMGKSYDEYGIGYKNISKRLAILYPDNHVLEINKDTQQYGVLLTIPLN